MGLLLEARGVSKRFDGLVAVDTLDFSIEQGTIAAIIGPNGAGKTTFFNVVTGFYKPSSGVILLDGKSIGGLRPNQLTRSGIGRTFQTIRLFNNMTVLENVLVGMNHHLKAGWIAAILRPPRVRREEAAARAEALEHLAYVGLAGYEENLAGSLSYGLQRRLEIARALATRPRLLLLDEPTAGMNHGETAVMTDFIRRLRDERGLTILLIEHDMQVVMAISDKVTVLEYGKKITEGPPAQVQHDERVIEAYLGRRAVDQRKDQRGQRDQRGQSNLIESKSNQDQRGQSNLIESKSNYTDPVDQSNYSDPFDPSDQPLLQLENVHSYYGNIHALQGISLHVFAGEIVTLIGANGAGKSTTIRTISGIMHPRVGSIRFAGTDIHDVAPHALVTRGIAQAPEGRRIFPRLSVHDNLVMGAFTRADRAEIEQDLAQVYELFPRLRERRKQHGGTLSGGEQQMLAIGRALMARPRLLLLDEPSMGLAPVLVELIFDTIVRLNRAGMTILLVEQNALMALEVAHRAYVLQSGQVVLQGEASALLHDESVRRIYLGE